MVECSLGHEANFLAKLNNHFVRHKQINLPIAVTLSFFLPLSLSMTRPIPAYADFGERHITVG